MRIVYGAKTDVGLRRLRNEDSLCADPELGLYIVCDGLGGHGAGDVASRLAVDVIQKHLREAGQNADLPLIGTYDRNFSPQMNRLASATRLANRTIIEAARTLPEQKGMATTVVSALIKGQVLSVAHVGDSRMYLVRGDTIEALTADHSFVAEQVRRGTLTEAEAERSPQRNIITRALGLDDSVEVELDEVQLLAGDIVLLCSDGLTHGVKPAEILQTVRNEPNPLAASERLVELATAAGGEDNTTVIVLKLQGEEALGSWRWFLGWLTS